MTLDMEKDEDVSIILGHPFLNTCDMVIEVRRGRFTLRMGDEQVVFNLSNIVKSLSLLLPIISFRQKILLMLWWKPHSQV